MSVQGMLPRLELPVPRYGFVDPELADVVSEAVGLPLLRQPYRFGGPKQTVVAFPWVVGPDATLLHLMVTVVPGSRRKERDPLAVAWFEGVPTDPESDVSVTRDLGELISQAETLLGVVERALDTVYQSLCR